MRSIAVFARRVLPVAQSATPRPSRRSAPGRRNEKRAAEPVLAYVTAVPLAESDASQCEPMGTDYQRPGWFTKHVFNPLVAGLTRLGVSLVGSRVLEVRGRKSGEWRRTPVNPLNYEGEQYIVAPRGETQWVRNLRASGEGRLRKGRRIEEFSATELPDDEKMLLLRAYLKKWAWEVGAFFQGVGADAPDDDLRRIAPLHPVFRISRRA
jgi:deazaflavin-dependent oxidoreductase (nitroreductase family)